MGWVVVRSFINLFDLFLDPCSSVLRKVYVSSHLGFIKNVKTAGWNTSIDQLNNNL